MSYSIQTNVDSIRAQENLRVNSNFQSRTINRLTSGYRINSSSDDAAGLAVANKFRGDITELNQGVRNANDGISTLEIVDGGLNNISQMLDRLRTLATESASASFTGSRQTLNTEYQSLLKEIDRQASNIGLSTGAVSGRFAKSIDVYIGGGSGVSSNAKVSVDLNGTRVDSTGLAILNSNIMGGSGTAMSGVAQTLNGSTTFLSAGTQDFVFHFTSGTKTVTINGGTTGITGQQALDQFNQQLTGTGVSAMMDSTGKLKLYGEQGAFNVTAGTASAGTGVHAAAGYAANVNMAVGTGKTLAATTAATTDTLSFVVGGRTLSVAVTANQSLTTIATNINDAASSYGIYAVLKDANTLELQGTQDFSWSSTSAELFANSSATAPTGSLTQNSLDAITALTRAVDSLGAVQGKVGTGQNQLQYALSLAQSQITSFSAAESRIRDTDVASEAANLTKAQVLQQASIAAMAQANSAPQAIMALLRG
jgi:flagellin